MVSGGRRGHTPSFSSSNPAKTCTVRVSLPVPIIPTPAHTYLGAQLLGRVPCSSHSCFEIHMLSLSAMILASTAPPRNTMCRLRGGSSILTLNLLSRSGLPPSTLVSHSCLISFSSRDGRPGYMLLPPDRTMALKSDDRTSTSADWIVLKQELGDARLVAVDEVGLEQTLGRLEPFGPHTDDAAVGQRIALHQHRRVLAQPLVQLQVVGDVAELLLDLAHRLEVGGPVQRVAPAEEKRNQVAGDVAAGHVEAAGQVVEDDGFVDGDDVRHAVARVDHDARAETWG